jgi:hypothetical protein
MKESGYHIAIADVAAMELGDLLALEAKPDKPNYFNLDHMLDLIERFISPLTPFWPGRTEIKNRGDIHPRRNKEWQLITRMQWRAYLNGFRARNFYAQKIHLDGKEEEVGAIMNRTAEMKVAERKMWIDQIERAKVLSQMTYEEQIRRVQTWVTMLHPQIKNVHRRLDLRIHRIVHMSNRAHGGGRIAKNDALDNHLDFSHFYPVVVITNDQPYIKSCIDSGSRQAVNILTTDQMVNEWRKNQEIRLKWSSA